MKILLTSNSLFFDNNFQNIFSIPIKDVKLAYIITAVNGVEDKDYIERNCLRMRELGFDLTEIDIDGKSEKELDILLKNFNFIYVAGGNPFYLLKSIKESGFDRVVKKLVSQGIVYVGSSAGAYVACPNIDMAVWKDKHTRCGLTDFTAIGLVNFLVIAHYKEYWKEIIKKNLPNSKYPVKVLRDGQALLIEDDKVNFIGEGKEEVII